MGRPNGKTGSTRDGNGRFSRDPETAVRDAEACRLRTRGLSYREIAEQLGVDVATAHEAVQRSLRDTAQEAADDVRRIELDRLDEMYAKAREIIDAGEPELSLKALDRLLRIQERRARLLGLDSATKVEVQGGLRYEITGVDMDALR